MQVSPDEEPGKYFAFVNFETHEAAAAACQGLHEKEVDGSKLYVDRAQTKAERQNILQRRHEQKRSHMAQQMEGKNVYVKNLAASVDEEGLKEAFAVWISHAAMSSLLMRPFGYVIMGVSNGCLAEIW